MLRCNDPQYDIRKPPILLITKQEEFTCGICSRPGWGPPNSVVHPGRCRDEHSRRIAKRAAAKRKARKLRVEQIAAEFPPAIAC